MTRLIYENPGALALFFDDPTDEDRFDLYFFSEARCVEFVVQRLFTQGFACPRCSRRRFALPTTRSRSLVCTYCRKRVWFLKDTIFHRTKLPLTTWFRAAFLLRFQGTNASSLAEMLGLSYKTSWLLCQKLRYAMGLLQQKKRCTDAVVQCPPLRFAGVRGLESPHAHGCERLERPDFALRTDELARFEEGPAPWQRWLAARGPLPQESRLADEVRLELSSQFQSSIGERYLQLYLDEWAYRFDRRWLGLWRFVGDLADALPLTPPRTRRQLGNFPSPRRARPWLALRERSAG
jgi:hypothetical protein